MGSHRFFYFVLQIVTLVLLVGLLRAEQNRAELTELLKDKDVREIYAAAAQDGGKVVARMGIIDTPDGKGVRVLWLFVKTRQIGLRLHYFRSIDNNLVLVILLDGSTTDVALRELFK